MESVTDSIRKNRVADIKTEPGLMLPIGGLNKLTDPDAIWKQLNRDGRVLITGEPGTEQFGDLIDGLKASEFGIADYRGEIPFRDFRKKAMDGVYDKPMAPMDRDMFDKFLKWTDAFTGEACSIIFKELTLRLPVGFALLARCDLGHLRIAIGVGSTEDAPIKDLTRASIAAHHMMSHCLQEFSDKVPEWVSSSLISSCFNNRYHYYNYNGLPHEIDAESVAIRSTWTCFLTDYPDDPDTVMGEYLTDKAKGGKYMLPAVKGGIRTFEQMSSLFDQAIRQSFVRTRKLPPDFLKYGGDGICSDDIIKLFVNPDGSRRRDTMEIYRKLTGAKKGIEFDNMLTVLNVRTHPDIVLFLGHHLPKPLVDESMRRLEVM